MSSVVERFGKAVNKVIFHFLILWCIRYTLVPAFHYLLLFFQAQALGLAAKRKIENAAKAYGHVEAVTAEQDSLRSEVGDLKIRLKQGDEANAKLAKDLKKSKETELASREARGAMTQ